MWIKRTLTPRLTGANHVSNRRCLYGKISYSIDNPPTLTGVCHCKNCQCEAGSAFSTLASVPLNELLISGETKVYTDPDTDSGNTVKRFFCGNCGSPIY